MSTSVFNNTPASPDSLALSQVHRDYLTGHAVAGAVIAATGIYSSGDRVAFPWCDEDRLTIQTRQWPEPDGGLPPGQPKYLWADGEKDRPLHLWAIRPVTGSGGPVIIAEGTKQALAVASWAPPQYAVYGMPGCDIGVVGRLQRAGLKRFAGLDVLIWLDADAADNLNVYEGGEKLAELLELAGAASVTFPRTPAQGTDGIDDFLALVQDEDRAGMLAKLLERAGPKPAERRPKHRKTGVQAPDTGDRPLVVVNDDRREVIRRVLGHLRDRWSGSDLFCYGGVLARLRAGYAPDGRLISAATEPLDRGAFARWLAEGVYTARYVPPGANSPGRYEPAWPDAETLGALLASGDEFAPLNRVSRTPFARPDGSIATTAGYDPATGTLLVTGNSGMDRLTVPEHPSAAEAAAAAKYLLEVWLGDFEFRDEGSRANALALVLTPFTRGLVPLVPLAVISGPQPGVGKNLLADCISLMAAGEAMPTLPWLPDDDDENRKQILSAFRAGTSLVCFDEAHVIGGTALPRAITSLTYSDRILGVSKQASYPNQVTWLALGNQVQVNSDMARRAYFTEIYPDCPDPENRPESDFAIPDLRGWTLASRPDLVTAALVIIRAWFAAGQPSHSRGALMGSFETWDKMMSGILGYAGVGGFLSNLAGRRAEQDTAGGFWSDHLAWLAGQFGSEPFTAADASQRAVVAGRNFDGPPGLDEPGRDGFTRNLGLAWSKNQDRWYGRRRIIKTVQGHDNKARWVVQDRENPHVATPPTPPTTPVVGGVGGVGGLPTPSRDAEEKIPLGGGENTHAYREGRQTPPTPPTPPAVMPAPLPVYAPYTAPPPPPVPVVPQPAPVAAANPYAAVDNKCTRCGGTLIDAARCSHHPGLALAGPCRVCG